MSRPNHDLLDQLINELADRISTRLNANQTTRGETEAEQRSPWMNMKSAAAYLDWPPQRIYKLTAQGAIPHFKQDGRLLFNRQELDRWLRTFRQRADWIDGPGGGISQ